MLRKLRYEEKGYSLVTVALLLMFVVVPLLALVVDVGYAYVQQQRMQIAADAAALAGTRALFLEGEARAQQVAAEYAQRNGAKNVIVTVNPGEKKVRVEAKTDFPTLVATILGIDTLATDSPAAAIHGAVAEMREGVYPITIDDNYWPFVEGQIYDIYVGVQPGNFGWLSWDGTMSEGYLANCLDDPTKSREYINPETGENEPLAINKWVWGRPGVANSISVRNALDNLIDKSIIIVVWKDVRSQGSDAQYLIAGFAKFILRGYRLPTQNRISGEFVEGVDPSNLITLDPSADFGLHGIKLTE